MASRKQVQKAALLRGMIFDGVKICRNPMYGRVYEVITPNARILKANTLQEAYDIIMTFPKIRKANNKLFKLYIKGDIEL